MKMSTYRIKKVIYSHYRTEVSTVFQEVKVPRLYLYLFIYLFTEIGLLPGGSGYFTCKQNMKLVTTRFN